MKTAVTDHSNELQIWLPFSFFIILILTTIIIKFSVDRIHSLFSSVSIFVTFNLGVVYLLCLHVDTHSACVQTRQEIRRDAESEKIAFIPCFL